MAKNDFNLLKLDNIVKNTISTISSSKDDLNQIADDARNLCTQIEGDYIKLKNKVSTTTTDILLLEKELSDNKSLIEKISTKTGQFSSSEIKYIYDTANTSRSKLILKRNEEQLLIRKRNVLEFELKETLKTLNKAEKVVENISVSINILSDDLQKISQEIEYIEMEQQVGIKIIKAQEDERQRVAREIHDGPAQVLSNVVIKSEICDRLIDMDATRARAELIKLRETIIDCLGEVKRIVYDLRPLSLEEQGLIVTLEKHIKNFSQDAGIEVDYKVINPQSITNSGISLTIFRVIQECLNNIKKHSEATLVKIVLDFKDTHIDILTSDNGKGYNIDSLKDRKFNMNQGFGLISMKERIKLLHGSFEIKSFPNEGATVEVKIPINCEK